MSDQIHLRIRLFANARDVIGLSSIEMDVRAGTTIEQLVSMLLEKYSIPEKKFSGLIYSRNHVFVEKTVALANNDEIGIFPPVSGGSDKEVNLTRLVREEINIDQLSREITSPSTGAVVIFTGYVRGETPGTAHPKTRMLEYEVYETMAEKMMDAICAEIREKWAGVHGIIIVQRIGQLLPGEIAAVVAVSSGHRDEGCFEAARYGIDRLKEVVPVWKKEIGPDGEEWIEGEYHPIQGR